MRLHPIDWVFIAGYCVVAFAIGIYFSKRASRNLSEFFVAGRNLPWWVAGTSIVATTFAADTPLAVSGFARGGGIYANWFWWSALMSGMLCVFFYARLWRRAGVITDVEFIELRYAGKPASVLRGFMAVYSGVLQNCIVMGWVMLAMMKICEVMLGWPEVLTLVVLLFIAVAYTILSGFWGVVMTDMLQFIMAMCGAIALAVIVLVELGGPSAMVEQIRESPNFRPEMLHFVPDLRSAGWLITVTFAVQVTVQWWGGGQGGGYLAQRLFATKDETHSALAALWFNFAHYVLRPWPWLIVGLASIVFFSDADLIPAGGTEPDFERAYPMMIARFLPTGLRGLMVASLLAAFMSTMDTQLNWGASYLVNDLYKRFIRPHADDRHYVNVSRLAMVGLMGVAALTAWQSDTIQGAWIYLAKLTAGAGFVGLLRWYWWRVNAWSEISALLSSLVIANGIVLFRALDWLGVMPASAMASLEHLYSSEMYPVLLVIIIAVCTAIWVSVTFLTRPVSRERLEAFFRQVRPGGWWSPVASACPDVPRERAAYGWLGWLAGVASIYAGLFGVGYLCLGRYVSGSLFLAVFLGAGWYMVRAASRAAVSAQQPGK